MDIQINTENPNLENEVLIPNTPSSIESDPILALSQITREGIDIAAQNIIDSFNGVLEEGLPSLRALVEESESLPDTNDSIQEGIDSYEDSQYSIIDVIMATNDNEISEDIPEEAELPFLEMEPSTPETELPQIQLPVVNIVETAHSRFSGADWFTEVTRYKVTLLGVGGIGSYIAYCLARLDVHSLTLWDSDIVDSTNLAGQFYRWEDVGRSKVISLYNTIKEFSGFRNVYVHNERFQYDNWEVVGPVVFCGFDNMEARSQAFLAWKQYCYHNIPSSQYHKTLFIDGRLAAEEYQIFCLTHADTKYMKEYEEKWLFSDDEADATDCSYKQTSHVANDIASKMINCYVNWCSNLKAGANIRHLPFMIEYDSRSMDYKSR